MEPVIQVEGLTRGFPGKRVLENCSLTVQPGTVFALLGENGAGKSTLIRTLLGFHRPQAGSVRVLGMDPVREPLRIRQQVGFVSDSHEQYEWMRVGEAGWFASGFYPAGYLERYRKLIDGYELPQETRLKDLSKGMRAQVSLSLALAMDPGLLILDEPTSGLDPLVRRKFLEGMIERAAVGKTVFLSSHQIHEVERVADSVAILAGGSIVCCGLLDDLKKQWTRVSVALRDPLLAMPAEFQQVQVCSGRRAGRSWDLMVAGDAAELARQLAQHSNVMDVQIARPALEDLYLAVANPGEDHLEFDDGDREVPISAV